jgi:hypothetical protein
MTRLTRKKIEVARSPEGNAAKPASHLQSPRSIAFRLFTLAQGRRIAVHRALAELLVLPFVRFDAVPAPRELDPEFRVFGGW